MSWKTTSQGLSSRFAPKDRKIVKDYFEDDEEESSNSRLPSASSSTSPATNLDDDYDPLDAFM